MIAEFPEKLQFLFEPHPYKILYGGRDGTKSWGMARALAIIGAQHKIRWLCARETMQSIRESVHHLLKEQIAALGLQDYYRVEKARIVGTVEHSTGMYGRSSSPGYTEFLFAGLRHNVDQIKSYEQLDGVWVEEAGNVSKNSWTVVLPTLRKEGCEIWASFNPHLASDFTYDYFITKTPPTGAVVVRTGWQDNNWLSEISKQRIVDAYARNPAEAAHIYGGECVSDVEGAIFGEQMKQAQLEGRITDVPYNRTRPVETVWDLGFGDPTAIWFVQPYDGWFHFIDYLEGNHLEIADYVIQLQNKRYVYGLDWVPHDAVDTIIHHNMAGADKSMSIEQLMRRAGRKPRLIPKMLITDQINAARTIFPQCRFDLQKCTDGLQALRHYKWPSLSEQAQLDTDPRGIQSPGPVQRKPLHNWASHASSAFCGAAVALRQPKLTAPAQRSGSRVAQHSVWS